MQLEDDGFGAGTHRRDGCPSVARCRELGGARARRARDLVAAHVGLDPDRLVHACVDDEHVDPVRFDPLAQEGVLDPFGVERAEEDDGRHYARSASGSTPR